MNVMGLEGEVNTEAASNQYHLTDECNRLHVHAYLNCRVPGGTKDGEKGGLA